ncbi:MAG: EAL domain-containing protein [Spirochaetales bacterium]|nr:EAL domain-containing protein [Spirochaetales bacterium]
MGKDNLLIVEDERIIAIDLQRRLEKFGFSVCGIASTGQEALELCERHSPELVLMDIMLSGDIDGIEAADIIRKTYGLPVIFLTAYSDEKTLERAKRSEPAGFILKPFKEKELYTTIDIALYKNKINKKLRIQELWRTAILESTQEGIIATDMKGNIRFMNTAAVYLCGYKEEEARDQNIGSIVSLVDEKTSNPFTLPLIESDNNEDSSFILENTSMISRDNTSFHVEGIWSRIKGTEGEIEGHVLAVRDISQLREMSEQLTYQASHDILTGLANRDEFSQHLSVLIADAKKNDRTHALLYLDLDQFKIINDTCGHAAGDELLLETSSIIQNVVRSSDVSARLGGDEFGILLEGSNKQQALFIAQRLHDQLNNHKLVWEKKVFNVNSSIALVMITQQSKDLNSILAAADDALYLAKDEGGNRIKVYETKGNIFVQRRGEMEWISRLTGALEEDRFKLYYQPIIPLDEKKEIKAKSEILIRMVNENGDIIAPADFIPAAERYKLMNAIDRWIIRKSLISYSELEKRKKLTENTKRLAINLSAQSLTDETLLKYIESQFNEIGVPPECFSFEVTETAAISNMNTAVNLIKDLRRLGCTFSLDDFGSGFSSFSYLKDLPVDYLKIDGIFVKEMDTDPVNRAMVEAMNNLGHVIGKKTIAEFVHNEAIYNLLREAGVDYAQGYHISAPVPLDSLLQ